jgi:hypothetical protein
VLISVEGRGKNQLDPIQESRGDVSVLSHCSLVRNTWSKPTGVLGHCCERETNCWFSICWVSFSDPIPKAKKDINVHIRIHNSSSCKLYRRFLGTLWSYYVYRLHNKICGYMGHLRGKQWQTTPKNLPRMQRTRAIPVAWLGSGSCPNKPKGWILILIIIIIMGHFNILGWA